MRNKQSNKVAVAMISLGAAVLWAVAADPGASQDAAAKPDILYVDHMDQVVRNDLGGRNSVYIRAPSRAAFSKAGDYGKCDVSKGETNSGLKITFDKKNEGGSDGTGGFCGYYTLLHRGRDDFLDASEYKYLAFWVRGEKGDEKFKIGAADRTWAEIDDSVKSDEIGKYLPAGKITPDWQLAVIPVDSWFIDWKQMHAISVCFEGDLYDTGAAQGIVYIDDVVLTKNKPDPGSIGLIRPAS